MSNPFETPEAKRYNLSPPSDDGVASSANQGKFSTIIQKLARPLFDYVKNTDQEVDSAFDTLENRRVRFTEVTASNVADFAFSAANSRVLVILIGAGGQGVAGNGVIGGSGGGAGGVAVIFDNVLNADSVPTLSIDANEVTYTNSPRDDLNDMVVTVTKGNSPGSTNGDALGGTVSSSTTSGNSFILEIQGEDAYTPVLTVPGRGGKSFFGAGGPGAGGRGGDLNTASPDLPDAANNVNKAWVWEIE